MGSYKLYQSNNLISLLDKHSSIFLSDSPLEKNVKIVVQNAGLGEWLIRQLTLKYKALMGLEILMPEQSLRYFAEGFDSVRERLTHEAEESVISGVLYLDSLKIIVYKALQEVLKTNKTEYSGLKEYIGKQGAERIWPLADTVAGIFYHYGMNCPALLERWKQNQFVTPISSPEHDEELWQFQLWNDIFQNKNYTHLSQLLANVIEKKEKFQGDPCRVILFGSMFLGEIGLKFFHYLSQEIIDVHHFILSPSKNMKSVEIPHFLENNCRLFQGFDKIISKLGIQHVELNWKDPWKSKPQLLQKLQASILEGCEMKKPIFADNSLEIHAVCGARRTVEVLKDRILQALRDDPNLRPIDIGVLAPDINIFAPHIEAVFPQGKSSEHLDFNLIDLPAVSHSSYRSAFRQIMELPGSLFGRSRLLDLFNNPCFRPCIDKPELKRKLREIADNLNIRWGMDGKHREEDGVFYGISGSWQLAFNRLIAGYFQSDDDLEGLKPVNPDGSIEEVGILIQILWGLSEDFRNLHRQSMTLRDWIVTWEKKVEKWLTGRQKRPGENTVQNDNSEQLKIKSMFRNLMNLNTDVQDLSAFSDNKLPWTVFKSILENHLDSLDGRRGRYLTRGVTGSSLKPMRAIPFRRIYLLGMDEGAWPRREVLPDFDLRDYVPRLIDLSRESVERFAFMETILSAEDNLSFFINGKEPASGDNIPPASLLVELMDYLGAKAEKLIHNHPLSSCDGRAFTGEGKLASSSSSTFELTQALIQNSQNHSVNTEKAAEIQAVSPLESYAAEINFREIENFLKNPVEYFFTRRLGVKIASQNEEFGEDDPLESHFLDWWHFCQNTILESPQLVHNTGEFLRRFSEEAWMEARLADVPLSRFGLERLEMEARSLSASINTLEQTGLNMDEIFQCRFLKTLSTLPQRKFSSIPGQKDILAPVVNSAEGNGEHCILGSIPGLHSLSNQIDVNRKIWCMVEYSNGSSIRNKIKGWLAALLLGCASNIEQANDSLNNEDKRTAAKNKISTNRSLPEEFRVYSVYPGTNLSLRRYFYNPSFLSREDNHNSKNKEDANTSDVIDMSQAKKLLENILLIMHRAETEPLCLYPALAGKILEAEEIPQNPQELTRVAAESWNKLLENHSVTKGAYYFLNCPYRERYLREPNFSSPLFFQAWKTINLQGGLN